MKELNYEWDEKIHSTLITQAIIREDLKLLEERWTAMLAAKFEPSVQICCQRILYYARYTNDTDKVVKCFNEAIEYVI
jgi:hypothetical protein